MPSLAAALSDDHAAVEQFATAALALPRERWSQEVAPGKWSAAQICEHVALTYEIGVQTLRGETTVGAMPRWLRPLIRGLFLGRTLKSGKFPKGAKSPKAFHPTGSGIGQADMARRLREGAARFAEEVKRHPQFDHPVFGKIPAESYARLQAVHTRHHLRQFQPPVEE